MFYANGVAAAKRLMGLATTTGRLANCSRLIAPRFDVLRCLISAKVIVVWMFLLLMLLFLMFLSY